MLDHLTLVWTLLAAAPAPSPLVNQDFAAGLDGWAVSERGGAATPGTVAIEAGAAVLREGDSFAVSLAQTFTAPAGLQTLTARVEVSLDESGGPIPDAAEVSIEDAAGFSLVPTWRTEASTFYNAPEGGAPRLGSGAGLAAGVLTVDLRGVAAGTVVTLRFSLVGADGDHGSFLRVSGLGVVVVPPNGAPVASAGADATVECGPGAVRLDGSGSSDPDGDALAYVWKDGAGAVVGAEAVVARDGAVGTASYTLEVADPGGLSSADSVVITVQDTVAPTLGEVGGALLVDADARCEGAMPALSASATDLCGPVTVTQTPAAGAALALGAQTVTMTATDPSGNAATREVPVTLRDVTPPSLTGVPGTREVVVDGACTGLIPDLTASGTASDGCPAGLGAMTQSPPAGTALALNEATAVTLRVMDAAGNAATATTVVTLTDPAGTCGAPPVTDLKLQGGGGCAGGGGGAGASGLALLAALGGLWLWRRRRGVDLSAPLGGDRP